ncbi:hypothetical protein C440_17111 [Haloferax mucosum ATCC BAA-1512]|uniref:Uncharacterized protein n=1 Tax=Haloferax mucosum ATCC BAA-1512 TaxID=662479 RepID=M0I000_9EURY|nr:hypothetical protein [Haloferax mucosum]ELZ90145.1 hypothetical protein C440_17111 [Haloferax mucosum ATCC BAA-1512]
MSPPTDDDFQRPIPTDPIDDTPTVSCSQCDDEWDLSHELDVLQLGNQSVEQFALDHHRHTGHFPDGATPWVATCQQCPDAEQFISETPARRWARTHTRHTRHDVELVHEDEVESVIASE